VIDVIFSDGFESGSLSAWSSSVTDGNNLSVSNAAGMVGSFGLQAVINDNNPLYVVDETPSNEQRYRARFYFDPNSITMKNGNAHFIFMGYTTAGTTIFRVEFRFYGGEYLLRVGISRDNGTWINSSWSALSNTPHFIELDWQSANAPDANNGYLAFWIDGTQTANLTGVDNDTRRVEFVRLGAITGIESGTRGTYYFDAFESRRQSYIGP
jgi:hypothetical protein